jgi:hypothetical protein
VEFDWPEQVSLSPTSLNVMHYTMKRNIIIIIVVSILVIITGTILFSKIERFFDIDACLDRGGSWNYETEKCELYDSINSDNKLADSENANLIETKISVERDIIDSTRISNNFYDKPTKRPDSTMIINPTIDTSKFFGIWTYDLDGPHADFRIKRTEFYIVDYDGNGSIPYILNQDSIEVFYPDFVQKGRIISVDNDSMIIKWNEPEEETKYYKWKN